MKKLNVLVSTLNKKYTSDMKTLLFFSAFGDGFFPDLIEEALILDSVDTGLVPLFYVTL